MLMRENNKKKTKDLKISLIVFAVITVIAISVMLYINKLMPQFMIKQGQKYLQIKQYGKALKMFDMASESMKYACEPIYYKTLAISGMPQNYENQKILFEYSKMNDCDNVSETATEILNSIRDYYFKTSGETYIDNVLYKDKLIRWNNNEYITYFIDYNDSVPKEYIDAVKRGFFNWQIATNSELRFKETINSKEANIYINFVDKLPNGNLAGSTTPVFNKNKLSQMKINIRKKKDKDNNFSSEQILSVLQHEIGHALGIWGHSADEQDVMYYGGDEIDSKLKVISPRDVNTITIVYKMIPDIINKELTQEQRQLLFFHNILTIYPNKNFKNEIDKALLKSQGKESNLKNWLQLSVEFQNAGQYERANYILIKLIPYVNEDSESKYLVLYNIANNFYKLKDFENAKKYINSALAIKQTLNSKILEADLYIKLKDINAAQSLLKNLFADNPNNIEAALKLAETYNINKDRKKEKKVLETLIKNNPNALKDKRVVKYKINKKNQF